MYHATVDLIIIWGLFVVLIGIWKVTQYAAVQDTRSTRQFLLVLYTSLMLTRSSY